MHAQSCPTFGDPTDCSLPGSSVHGISQARIFQWVAISSSRGSSRLRDQTCIGRQTLYPWAAWEALIKASSTERERRKEKREKEKQGGTERKNEKSASCSWCAENPPVVSPLRMHAKALLITHSLSDLRVRATPKAQLATWPPGPQGTLSSRLSPFPLEMEISSLPWDLDLRVTFLEASSVTPPHTVCTHTHTLSPLSKFFSPSWIFLIFFFNWHLLH